MLRYANQLIRLDRPDGSETMCQQVSKTKAKRLWEMGRTVWLHSCNLRIDNVWQRPMPFRQAEYEKSFEMLVIEFTNYNCNGVCGKYPIFFVEVEYD